MTIRKQTFAFKSYQDTSGWHYDKMEYLEELRKVSSAFDKEDGTRVIFPGYARPKLPIASCECRAQYL